MHKDNNYIPPSNCERNSRPEFPQGTVTIPAERYEKFIESETRLAIIARMIQDDSPYGKEKYFAVLGIEEEPEKDGEDDGKS